MKSGDFSKDSDEDIADKLHRIDDRRIFVIAEALRRGIAQEKIHEITQIDLWFIDKIALLVEMCSLCHNKFIKRPLWNFDNTVVKRRLKACHGLSGDCIWNLIQRIAERNFPTVRETASLYVIWKILIQSAYTQATVLLSRHRRRL